MRTASYRDDVLEKLRACMVLAVEHDVAAVVITGDLFHRKAANHTSHQTVQDVRTILSSDIPVLLVPGNHDMARGSGNLSGQPFVSVLGENVQLLYGTASDGLLVGVPWDNAWEGERGAQAIADYLVNRQRPLVFAHAPLTPTPNPFGPEARGWLLTDDLTKALAERECAPLLIAYGHMHNRLNIGAGVMIEQGATSPPLYSNPGALSRGTIADTEQEPMVALITYNDGAALLAAPTVEVRYLPVPHRPAAEVFRLREHAARTDREEGIAHLATGLATAETYTVTPEALVAQLEALPLAEGVDATTWRDGIGYAAAAVEGAAT